jgi:leucyl-tRNA synthetase
VLNPVAPHITHVLWQELGYAGDGDLLTRLAAGRSGRAGTVRDRADAAGERQAARRVTVPKDADKAAIEAAALASESVQKFIEARRRRSSWCRAAGQHRGVIMTTSSSVSLLGRRAVLALGLLSCCRPAASTCAAMAASCCRSRRYIGLPDRRRWRST